MKFSSAGPPRALTLIATFVDRLVVITERGRRAVHGYATVGRFASRGEHLDFDPDGTYSYESIHVGHHVNLGTRPTLLATRSKIYIGNHVLFGPKVTIRGGNHRIDLVGRYIDTVGDDEKQLGDDRGVVIEDDVWIGGNATILSGVRVGRGSVIGASAVVTKDVAPYSIVGGNPARVIRMRFTEEEIAAHTAALGH